MKKNMYIWTPFDSMGEFIKIVINNNKYVCKN